MSLISSIRSGRFWRYAPIKRAQRGVAAVEFALVLPVWVMLLLGCADATFAVLIGQRVDRISYTVTDIITQSEALTISDLDKTMLAAGQLMQPFEFGTRGIVIASSVYKPAGKTPTIKWQYAGGGTLSRGSKIGTTGSIPTLPNGLTLNDNDNVIIVEVYYAFEPMFINAGLFSDGDVYRVGVYKPRLSALINTPT